MQIHSVVFALRR